MHGNWIYIVHMPSMLISNKAVSLISTRGAMYWIQLYMMKFVSNIVIGRWFSPGTYCFFILWN
jgi:hypothetical protein